jgi:surfactin synthase thioesterase subunit
MKSVLFENEEVYYRVFGDGSPLVFLHGFLEESTMWDGFTKQFLNKHQIILIDLPCHGKSRYKEKICSMTYMANAVQTILEFENIKNPFVFGHSMGGYVGLELAKITDIKLTLIHSNFWADSQGQKDDRDRVVELVEDKKEFFIKVAIPNLFYKETRKSHMHIIEEVIEKANKIPKSEICAGTLGLKTRDENYDVMNTQNINIIQGEFDTIMTLSDMQSELKKLTKPQEISIIKNCGHMGIWEQTDELSELINEIISK